MFFDNIQLKSISTPSPCFNVPPTTLSDKTIQDRLNKILNLMVKNGYDLLVIYADKEHGGNFEYLTGFIPRFEEALLILDKNGSAELILGNENLKMSQYSRIANDKKLASWLSLPNQPMHNQETFESLIKNTKISCSKKIGLVGWKLFTSKYENNKQLFDIPYFIVDTIKNAAYSTAEINNATDLFISPKSGARIINNANEIAHYEYGANLASSAMLELLENIELGKKEVELAQLLTREGQPNPVITITAAGERFNKANIYPTYNLLKLGDKFSATISYKGGLTCRTAYVAHTEQDLDDSVKDYVEKVAKPYFNTVVLWLENIKIGVTGGELYQLIEKNYPKANYGWSLNPGHLVADEEWLASPIYDNSDAVLKSGMIFQIDIIPSHAGYGGVSIEDTIALADAELQEQIKMEYPELWSRIETRKKYIRENLNIKLPFEVLPLSNTVGYLRPYLLNKQQALTIK